MTTNTPILPGNTYHIYNRGNNRDPLFFEERNYRYFLKLYTKYIHPVVDTYAYCLLPNHFHLLVRIKTEEERVQDRLSQSAVMPVGHDKAGALYQRNADDIERLAQSLKPVSRHFNNMFIAYAKAINATYDHTGSVFESPFRRKLVDSESYFVTLIIYIHRNPYHHQIADFRDWSWSSYQAILSDAPTHIQRTCVLDIFGGRGAFVESHQQGITEEITIDWIQR